MTIPDIIYALHEDIITRDEARHLIDALAHMELSVGIEVEDEDGLFARLEDVCAEQGHEWRTVDTPGGSCLRCGTITIDRAALEAASR